MELESHFISFVSLLYFSCIGCTRKKCRRYDFIIQENKEKKLIKNGSKCKKVFFSIGSKQVFETSQLSAQESP